MTAACAGLDPMFDADIEGENYRARRHRVAVAIDICNTKCQMVAACERARQDAPSEGIWAGVLHESLHTKRNRAMEASA